MRNIDLTKKVMDRVVGFEKHRSRFWLLRIGIIAGLTLAGALFFLWLTTSDLIEQKSFDLLTLFGEESEIIKDYWKDTISIFLEELPYEKIVLALIFLVIFIILLFIFRKKIRLAFKKLKNLAKY